VTARKLEVVANRRSRKYSRSQLARRVAWSAGSLLFRLSPRPMFGWRAFVLRCFGADIGPHVHFYPTVRVEQPWNLSVGPWSAVGEGAWIYNLGKITLGARVTVSHRAHLCAGTHDYTSAEFPLLRPPIAIGDDAWICADAFVGPGVHVGEGAVVGARAVAVADVEPWTVVAGNPARCVKQRSLG
jgi:putative colanic acid biosynthesis acetyltransferase WcaF